MGNFIENCKKAILMASEHNIDRDEYYVDEYKKQSNKVILGADIDETM